MTMVSAAAASRRFLALLLLVVAAAASVTGVVGSSSKSFNITNSCSYTVWPAISSGAGSAAALDSTEFELAPGESRTIPVPSGWSGRVWGRTLCISSTSDSSGKFSCVTGDCGSGKQDRTGGGGPVTVAEFKLDGSGGMDLYDVSLIDGFNLPVMVAPQGGNCAPTGCMVDMNGVGACPPELRVTSATGGAGVGCKSACQAFGSPQYCCTGEYGNPDTCKPSAYSELFKKACPLAFSYAYDDGADSIFTCGGGGDTTYSISFCPSTSRTSGKLSTSSNSQPQGTGNLPHIDGTTPMPYTGGGSQQVVGGAAPAPGRIVLVVAILGVVTAALGLLAQFLGLFKLCCSNQQAGG